MLIDKPFPNTLIAALVLGFSLYAHAHEEQEMDNIHIKMEGTPGAVFSAHWRITQDGETIEHIEERGRVPAEYTFTGSALEGTVRSLGDHQRLEVDIQKGGNRSRSSTQGAGGVLTLGIH
ncbi:hypothetical protein B0H98_10459 [Vreelandella songnenensis]|uniref:Uncharacterized protein n=1 Tax=Vreelandella songnenensis TaxID=1176243 RepID=A0A2T0V3J7_9GAMM|nr:hypothetical protein [Halomonas songnenensis]PRY64755.1 hypothetical protein B0H98_10459 [Halomonas songnenensis]